MSRVTVAISLTQRPCSLCGSVGEFVCIGHCEDGFCAQCTRKHRTNVIKEMRKLLERLNDYHMRLLDSNTTTVLRSTASSQSIDNSTETNLSLQSYSKMLREYLEKDQLIDAKTLANMEKQLQEHLNRLNRHVQSSSTEQSSSANIIEPTRSGTAPQVSRLIRSRKITISLNVQRPVRVSKERSFSVGQHPVVVSLIDSYIETVLCRGRDNSVILISLLSIDVYTRGAALTWSIPLSRVLGNTKDKILAGVWCSYTDRLILVGRYHFYLFNTDEHRVRCLCECGCGCRNCTGTLRPKIRRYITPRFRCGVSPNEYIDCNRFIASNHTGLLFYAYKSGKDSYRLDVISLKRQSTIRNPEQENLVTHSHSQNTSTEREMKPMKSLLMEGSLSALSVTPNRLAFVYRRFAERKTLAQSSKDSWETNHYFAFYDHSLNKLINDAILPSTIQWVTGMVAYGSESRYLLCDPRGQQLLLYQAMDGALIRRFHIAPINACCLSDGRLVLWIQKAYITSPIGKLHFITPPHLEDYAVVSKSFELLQQ